LLSNGTSAPTWSTNIAGQAGSVANGSVTPAKLSTGGLNWDVSGNVGIGTSSPLTNLDVTSATGARIRAGGAVGAGFELNGPEVRIAIPEANKIAFYTTDIARMSIDNTGIINAGGNPITNCLTTAKAWGGASSAGVINLTTYGVTSIARSALGKYLVTIPTAINGYTVVATPDSALGNQATTTLVSGTQFRVYTYNGAGVAADVAFTFAVFGV
jgi:hypothetical protein